MANHSDFNLFDSDISYNKLLVRNSLRDCPYSGFGLPYLGFRQCVKKVVVSHLVNSQPVLEDEQTFYTTEY